MDVSELWSALSEVAEAEILVVGTVINPSGVVAYLSGTLAFEPGTLGQLKPHPRPDVLDGGLTWLFSDRTFPYGYVPGLGGKVDRFVRFNPDGPMFSGLAITRRPNGVTAKVDVDFGSTTFGLEERDGLYVGDTTAIGGSEPHLYAFAFPERPSSRVVH